MSPRQPDKSAPGSDAACADEITAFMLRLDTDKYVFLIKSNKSNGFFVP